MMEHWERYWEVELPRRERAYAEPCEQFAEFRKLLDNAGIPWHDESEGMPSPMWRTKGDGFSVIWGHGSYGGKFGLLEARVDGVPDVTGSLTAEEAFEMVKEHCL